MDLKYNAIETKWNLSAKLKYIVDYKRKILNVHGNMSLECA